MGSRTTIYATFLTLTALLPAVIFAQDAEDLEEIVVTGVAASNRSTTEAKRLLPVISDSISADDIGTLPDFNLAEALQRVPGVNTDQDNGEDRFVIVRGFRSEYNFTTVDGLVLPSTDHASRAVLFDVIPSSVVQRVDILKSFEANMDGQAIGGKIDLVTRRAFGQRKNFFTSNLALGNMGYDDFGVEDVDTSYRIAGAYSTTFGSQDQFGFVFAGNLWNRDVYAESPTSSGTANWYFYDDAGTRLTGQQTIEDAQSAAFAIPEFASMFLYRSDRKRFGGISKLEYESPNRDLYSYIQLFQFERTDDERRDQARLRNREPGTPPEDLTTTSGHVVGVVEPAIEVLEQVFEDEMRGVQLGINVGFGENRVDAKVGYTSADLRNPGFNSLAFANRDVAASYTYNIVEDGFIQATPDDATYMNTAGNYQIFRGQFFENTNDENIFETRLDYSWREGQSFGLMAGFKYRDFERGRNREVLEYRPVGTRPRLTDDQLIPSGYVPPIYNGVPQLFIDANAMRALDYTDPAQYSVNSSSVSRSLNGDYSIEEDVTALYLMGIWAGDKYRATLGVRYENTDVTGSAFQRDGTISSGDPAAYSPFSTTSDYDNVLPRASFTYDLTDAWRLRLAYSQSIGRPDYVDIAPFRTVTVAPVDGTVSIRGGNPDLKPRLSDNYDVSLEYFFPDSDGLFSVGVFHKNIEDEIFDFQTLEEGGMFEGGVFDVTTTRPENAESAKLTGIEIGFIMNRLEFLPGYLANLGIAANYAYIDSDTVFGYVDGGVNVVRKLPLFFQPENIANVMVHYRQDKFEGRLSYNYKDEYLKSVNSASRPWTDRFYADRERLDAQVRWYFNDKFRIVVEGRNLTGSYANEIFAFGPHHTRRDTGKEFWLGASLTL